MKKQMFKIAGIFITIGLLAFWLLSHADKAITEGNDAKDRVKYLEHVITVLQTNLKAEHDAAVHAIHLYDSIETQRFAEQIFVDEGMHRINDLSDLSTKK